MKSRLLILIFAGLMSGNAIANETVDMEQRPFQLSFLYPLGSAGSAALNYSNTLSLNLLFGINGGVNGFELGGIGNYVKDEVKGVQIGGVTNIAGSGASGALISGVFNGSFGNTSGLMISTINLSSGNMTGVQLGVINYSAKMKGVQLGLINISDKSEEAVPIGLINIVKGGFYNIELSGGETLYGSVSFKMGVNRFYSILKIGTTYFEDQLVLAPGIGFGSRIPITERHHISIEISESSVLYNIVENKGVNLLSELDLSYGFCITPEITVSAGPSFNLYLIDNTINRGSDTLNIPYRIFETLGDRINTSGWVGFNVSTAFSF